MKQDGLSLFETNILYLLVAGILLTIGAYLQSINIKSGLIITEYVLVLIPVLIYIKMKGLSLIETLKLKKIKFKHGLLVIIITILNYPIALFFNLIMMTLVSFVSEIKPVPIPTAGNISEYIGLFFIIAISAGICEEVLFRGLLLSAYEKELGNKAIIITAIMFGIFHFNPQNLLGPIVLGALFAYLVRLTGSLYAGIIGHITNNGVAVTLGYVTNIINQKINGYTNMNNVETDQALSTIQLSAATVTIGVIGIVSGIMVFFIIKHLKKDFINIELEEDYSENITEIVEPNKKPFLLYLPVFIVFMVFCIVSYLHLFY